MSWGRYEMERVVEAIGQLTAAVQENTEVARGVLAQGERLIEQNDRIIAAEYGDKED